MARPNQDPQPQDDFPWYMKYGARVIGIIGAGFAMLFGLWNMIGVITGDLGCLVAGAFQIVSGLLVMLIESPCCFICAEQFQKVADMADTRPLWQRAALYCGVAVVPVLMCFSLASLFPGLLLFGGGALYGMMGLGKKASREDMLNNAQTANASRPVNTMGGNRSNLVANAQPISFTGPPAYDSNV